MLSQSTPSEPTWTCQVVATTLFSVLTGQRAWSAEVVWSLICTVLPRHPITRTLRMLLRARTVQQYWPWWLVKSDPSESPKKTETLRTRNLNNSILEPLKSGISHHCGYSYPLPVLPVFRNRRITPQFPQSPEPGKEIGAKVGHRRITWLLKTQLFHNFWKI